MGDLSENFDRKELACKCGCGKDDVDPDLVFRLQRLRTLYGKPIHINSGVRCAKYNAEVGGVDGSAHVEGLAADITCETSGERFALLSLILYYALFVRVGVGKRFIHLDIDGTKPGNVVWLYS